MIVLLLLKDWNSKFNYLILDIDSSQVLYCSIKHELLSLMEQKSNMATGKVKWFDGKKGFGFIVPEDGSGDIFVHYSAIKTNNEFRIIKEGMNVQYEVSEGKKGLQAVNVVVLS